MRFIVDEDLPPRLAQGLAILEPALTVVHMKEAFGAGTQDLVWLPMVGKDGDVVVSHDRKIWTKKVNRDQVLANGVKLFVVRGNGYCELVRTVIRAWPEIKRIAAAAHAGFAHEVRANGGIQPYRVR